MKSRNMAASFGAGIAIGMGIGIALDNIALGMGIGVAFGLIFSAAQKKDGDRS